MKRVDLRNVDSVDGHFGSKKSNQIVLKKHFLVCSCLGFSFNQLFLPQNAPRITITVCSQVAFIVSSCY